MAHDSSNLWILPMAGVGSRVGTLAPHKSLISIHGKPALYWFFLGLRFHLRDQDAILIVTRTELLHRHHLEGVAQACLDQLGIRSELHLHGVNFLPQGPAHSAFLGLTAARHEGPVVVVNPDQFCFFEFPEPDRKWASFVPIGFSAASSKSYVDLDQDENGLFIRRIWEKQAWRSVSSTGVYGFEHAELAEWALHEALEKAPHWRDEYFVGPSINLVVDKGLRVIPTATPVKFSLGEPESIDTFVRWSQQLLQPRPGS